MTSNKFNELKNNPTYSFKELIVYRSRTDEEEIAIKNIQCKDRILDYIEKYGRFSFKRTETKSGDTITFHSIPLANYCPYWEEYNEVAAFLGGYRNSSCGNTNKTDFFEKLYMLSNGCIYNQDKKKIADNYEEFFDYIMKVEYDYHAPILESTYRKLREAGWYEGRKIDISELVKECAENGVYLTESQKRFVEEFGGLEGSRANCYNYFFYIGDKRSTPYSKGKPVFFLNLLKDEDMERHLYNKDIIKITEVYGKNTVCVGCCLYNMDPILLTESGLMLLINSGEVKPLGRTVMEGFNVLLG